MKVYESVVEDGNVKVDRADGTRVVIIVDETISQTFSKLVESRLEKGMKKDEHVKSHHCCDENISANKLSDIIVADDNAIEGKECQLGVAAFGNIEDKKEVSDRISMPVDIKCGGLKVKAKRGPRAEYNSKIYNRVFGMPVSKYIRMLVDTGLITNRQNVYDIVTDKLRKSGFADVVEDKKKHESIVSTVASICKTYKVPGELFRHKFKKKKKSLVGEDGWLNVSKTDVSKADVGEVDVVNTYMPSESQKMYKVSSLVEECPMVISKKEFWNSVLGTSLVSWIKHELDTEKPDVVIGNLEKRIITKGYKPVHAKITSLVYMQEGMKMY